MNLDKYEDNFFKKTKQTTRMLFDPKDCVDDVNLPCKSLFEVKSSGDASYFNLSLLWTAQAQENGICAIIDSDFNCYPEVLVKHGINLSELLYVPCSEPNMNYEILYKLLEIKEISLIVVNSITSLFPLVHDIKEFTTNFTRLKESVQSSEASVLLLNPYHDLTYKIFSQLVNCQFLPKYEYRKKDGVRINTMINSNMLGFKDGGSFSTDINYI